MEKLTRGRYTLEYKQEAIRLVSSGQTVARLSAVPTHRPTGSATCRAPPPSLPSMPQGINFATRTPMAGFGNISSTPKVKRLRFRCSTPRPLLKRIRMTQAGIVSARRMRMAHSRSMSTSVEGRSLKRTRMAIEPITSMPTTKRLRRSSRQSPCFTLAAREMVPSIWVAASKEP